MALNLLSDIITFVRRIIKSPSNAQITDNLLIDYINRFWIMDVDARIQLFDLKTKYTFQTIPGVDKYNMPLYNVQVEPLNQSIGPYPVYQGFMSPMYVNGIEVQFQTQKHSFFNTWPNVTQQAPVVAIGNGGTTYNFTLPVAPNNSNPVNIPVNYLLRGHVDMLGIMATGNNNDPILGTTLSNTGGVPNIPFTSIEPQVYISATDSTGAPVTISDSGQFLTANYNLGLLMNQTQGTGLNPFGYSAMPNGYTNSFAITGITQATQAVLTATTNFAVGQIVEINGVVGMTQLNGNFYTVVANGGTTLTLNVNSTGFTAYVSGGTVESINNVINYYTGQVSLTFPTAIPAGVDINATYFFFQSGLPRGALFNNNVLTLRSPPDRQYLVEVDAYLSPTAFLNTTSAIPFGYMAEYIARGAARKILADTGDIEQFQFYEPLFKEQEMLVWKRAQRQFTATRSQTIYSQGLHNGQGGYNNNGGGVF